MFEDYKSFSSLEIVKELRSGYRKQQAHARAAIEQLTSDIERLEAEHRLVSGSILYTSFDCRVKEIDSFFHKLFRSCKHVAKVDGASDDLVRECFSRVKDIAGARFAFPYLADVVDSVNLIKAELSELGYATKVDGEEYSDQDMIEDGDEFGYRSYHFYVKIPTIVDIYGKTEPMICEIQGRSELQHIWAVKSHELLYKNTRIAKNVDKYQTRMKHLSDSLKVVDYFLSEVRDEVKEVEKEDE